MVHFDASGMFLYGGTSATMWFGANSRMLLQHDGTNGFIRTQSTFGGLFLGAGGASTLTLSAAGDVQLPVNNKSLQFTDASGAHPSFICQSDNNFIFNGTDASNNSVGVWGVAMRNGSSAFNVYRPAVFSGTITSDDLTTKRTSAPTTGAIFFGNTGTRYLYWDASNFNFSGSLIVGGNISSSSDARLKTNVRDLEDGLALVNAMRARRFDMYGKSDLGVVAQELQPFMPEVVSTNKDGMLSVDYSRLVAPLIAAVQNLSGRLERAGL
jgi:hypothetical protein